MKTGYTITDCTQDYSNPIRSRLFNITADPAEEHNLLELLPHLASQMQEFLENTKISLPAWQPEFTEKATGKWEKSDYHLVPWCELECLGTKHNRDIAPDISELRSGL